MSTKVEERPIETLQNMIDNSGVPFSVYEDGDSQIYCNVQMPREYLHDNKSVRVEDGLMLWDDEEWKLEREGAQACYEELDSVCVFDTDMNCTEEQLKQVLVWLEQSYGVVLRDHGVDYNN